MQTPSQAGCGLFWRVPVLCPEWLEVHCQTDGTSTIHLCCLAVQRRNFDFWCCGGIRGRYIKLKVKLILDQLVDIPALPRPLCPLFVGCDCEPVRVCTFVDLYIFDESLQFLHRKTTYVFIIEENGRLRYVSQDRPFYPHVIHPLPATSSFAGRS